MQQNQENIIHGRALNANRESVHRHKQNMQPLITKHPRMPRDPTWDMYQATESASNHGAKSIDMKTVAEELAPRDIPNNEVPAHSIILPKRIRVVPPL